MDINTVKRILQIAEPQLTAEAFDALRKTVQREYLYEQIEQCEAFINRKVYPTSEKPLIEQARVKMTKLNEQLAAL